MAPEPGTLGGFLRAIPAGWDLPVPRAVTCPASRACLRGAALGQRHTEDKVKHAHTQTWPKCNLCPPIWCNPYKPGGSASSGSSDSAFRHHCARWESMKYYQIPQWKKVLKGAVAALLWQTHENIVINTHKMQKNLRIKVWVLIPPFSLSCDMGGIAK